MDLKLYLLRMCGGFFVACLCNIIFKEKSEQWRVFMNSNLNLIGKK